ncbi:low specificity L-threonine aldolase [Alkaliphilus serpentinus]|uniref:Low specificity L-threonine aldolase n=1 Tax=Alkaliphilus serpentinus TaxID=1482731 RepID=A0A833HNH4_9FIRM|nr:low specificity L-threonine aldolase [Alkaliphilus serpentinus]KAB3529331.1 low specificity L-threonine aldolase [Alkaliphilus serpentinus]
MYSFKNDYSEGAHPNILKALMETNLVQQEGYGLDEYSCKAIEILRDKLNNPEANIHFVSGGTQANLIVISSILKPYESVISANSGHVNTHETGAIEATGHKINTIDTKDGKLRPEDVKYILEQHVDEHMVKPRTVYISNTTEVGTVYKKRELEELYSYCKENNLLLFLDGARLGSGLTAPDNDLSLSDLSRLVDAFYIGGTKNGGLLGEAIVISNESLKADFRYYLKQRGALLSKGRLLGIQFLELFKDDLYLRLASHANTMAAKLAEGIVEMGFSFLTNPESNQIFPILPDNIIDKLNQKFLFYVWSKEGDNMSSIRLVTSWATKEEAVDGFLKELKSLMEV